MKKHVFKRITAMVLIFVMCTFLMADNSLGVKAVTAEDVLVEDAQVTSEIGAENPASEVEVITSEDSEDVSSDEDLNAEELASDEVVSEDADTTEEVSEETEDVEPLEILYENGTTVLEDEATESYNLSYGTTTEEGFTSFDAVSERIDEIGNADGVYTITCVQPVEDEWENKWAYINNNFPTNAAELIFCGPTENSGLNYQARECITTDIKLTFNTYVAFPAGCDLGEVVINGTCLTIHGVDGEAAPSIETLSLNYANESASYIVCSTEINIGTCNFGEGAWVYAAANYDNTTPRGLTHYIIDTINIAKDDFQLNVSTEGYEIGHIILTTSSDITLSQIDNYHSELFGLELVDNGDGTTSVKLVDNGVYGFELSYDSVTEEYKTYGQVCDRINALASNDTEYTVLWKKEAIEGNGGWLIENELPQYAKKITFICEDDSSFAGGLGGIRFQYTNDISYPLEFQGGYAWLNQANFSEVIIKDSSMVALEGCTVDTLILPATTKIRTSMVSEVEEIVYTGTVSEESMISFMGSQVNNGDGTYTTVYPQLKVGDITLADANQQIGLDVQWGSTDYPVVFELTNAGAGSAWWNIWVSSAEYIEGYSLEKYNSTDGAGLYQYTAEGTPKVMLLYSTATEYFTRIDQAIQRIDSINNAELDYIIMPYNAGNLYGSDVWNMHFFDFPEKAKSLSIQKASTSNVSLSVWDADGIVDYPVTFEDVELKLFGTYGHLQFADLTIKDATECYVYTALTVEGTFETEGTHVIMSDSLEADTIRCNDVSSEYQWTLSGNNYVNNLEIPTGKYMKVALCAGVDTGTMLMVSNYSDDIRRVNAICLNEQYEIQADINENGTSLIYTKEIGPYYYVTDSQGNTVINSRSWIEVQNTIKNLGKSWEIYTIKVVNGKSIGALPTNASMIIIEGDDSVATPIIKCASAELSIPVMVEIRNAKLEYNGKPVNIKVNGKTLLLDDVNNIGKINGVNGFVSIYDNVEANSIVSLKSLTVCEDATLYVNGAVNTIAKLELYGELQVEGSNAVAVTMVETLGDAQITYVGAETINQNITINGTLSGNNLALVRMERSDVDGEEVLTRTNFPVGTKLLTAAKVSEWQFVLDGYGMTCYKKGNVVYAGMNALELYEGDVHIATFVQWSDVIAFINENGFSGNGYTIKVLEDFNIGGALTLPKAGTCASLTIDGSEAERTLYYTGDITIPAYEVNFGSQLKLQALTTAGVETTSTLKTATSQSSVSFYNESYDFKAISGKGTVYVKEDVGMKVTGTVTAHGIVVSEDAMVQAGGATTVNGILLYNDSSYVALGALKTEGIHYVSGTAQLVCKNTLTVTDSIVIAQDATIPFLDTMNGKAVSIKNLDLSNADADVKLNMFVLDANGIAISPANGQVIITTTGNLYTSQIALYDENIQVIPLYRTGNSIKVQGAVETPYHVALETEAGVEDLGNYASLKDVMTEIGRRNDKTGVYTVNVEEASFSNGAFPMPKAGTFDKIIFEGESITFTGALTLTGDTEFRNELIKVKSATDSTVVGIDVNIGKYTFTVGENHKLPALKSITGSAGSVLEIKENAELEVSGKVSGVGMLYLCGTLKAWDSITVTTVAPAGTGEIHYDLDKVLTISGTVNAPEGVALVLYPYKSGVKCTEFTEGTVIVDVASKADVTKLYLAENETEYVFYREKTAIKLGNPLITVFEDYAGDWTTAEYYDGTQFVTVNDAIDYINGKTEGDFVIRLEGDIPSAGTIKTIIGTGKTITIGTADSEGVTLNFTGTFTVDGGEMEISNVELRNSASANASVTLKGEATLTLCDTAINALTAPAGSKVIIANNNEYDDVDVILNGTAKCLGDFVMEADAVLWNKGGITAGNLIVEGSGSEVRLLSGKTITVNGEVDTEQDCTLCVNVVDKNGNLASVKEGTVLVTAANGMAGQFYTENVMTGTEDVCWLLTKSGKAIKTAKVVAYVYVDGARDIENPEFASFNEAKEYIASKADDGNEYAVELLCDNAGADLTNLPENLAAIVKSESTVASSVKLTTSLNINMSTDLELYGINLVASGKTINADEYGITLYGGAITAAKATNMTYVDVQEGVVTFTGKDSTINNVILGVDGSFKCPAFTGFQGTPLG